MVNNNQFLELLLQKREKLSTILQTTAEAAATVELDQSRVGRLSRMDALQAQSMSQESQRRNEQQLLDIEKALKRIDNDEFGDCFECGEMISPQRLELNPTATLCIECATKKERDD
ncbi:MAG TPA: TraR/DksA family transcriptional regulator [Ectothiorhodospiraceae bacterium]|nr:TraR/DksA family transcriptional regulator [Ectothiorhodospiraceae bacterium]